MAIPDYCECEAAVERGNPTALERFIYYNEPAGSKDKKEFRDGLEALSQRGRRTGEKVGKLWTVVIDGWRSRR